MVTTRPDSATIATRRIGVISDTHGYLPPEAADALCGLDLIIHAGDVDTPDVLNRLRHIAPVVAVRGNMDRGPWAQALPPAEVVTCGKIHIYVRHILHQIDLDPVAAKLAVVISGHTHSPCEERRNGVLFLNPGSACMPRNGTAASLAVLTVSETRVRVRFVSLETNGSL